MPPTKRDSKAPASKAATRRVGGGGGGGGGKRRTYLTTHKVVCAMAALKSDRGSTLASIRKKLESSLGLHADMSQVKLALQRAIKSGVVNEVVEDRYKVPRLKGAQSVTGTSDNFQKKRQARGKVTKAADRKKSRRVQKRREVRRARRQRKGDDETSNQSDADNRDDVDSGDGNDRDAGGVGMKDGVDRNREEAAGPPKAGCDVATYA